MYKIFLIITLLSEVTNLIGMNPHNYPIFSREPEKYDSRPERYDSRVPLSMGYNQRSRHRHVEENYHIDLIRESADNRERAFAQYREEIRQRQYQAAIRNIGELNKVLTDNSLTFILKSDLLTNNITNFHCQSTINQLVAILYDADGCPKQILTSEEKVKIARIIVNYLKKALPYNQWREIVTKLSEENIAEFIQIDRQETGLTWEWIIRVGDEFWNLKSEINKLNEEAPSHLNKIERNKVVQSIEKINELFIHNRFDQAKDVVTGHQGSNEYKLIAGIYNENCNQFCRKFLGNRGIENPCIDTFPLLKDYFFGENKTETLKHIFSSLTIYKDNPQFVKTLSGLFDLRGLPDDIIYNDKILAGINFPKTALEEYSTEKVLLYAIATQPNYLDEKSLEALRVGVRYLAQSFAATREAGNCSAFAQAILRAHENPQLDQTILTLENFTQLFSQTPQSAAMQRRSIVLALNLNDEINSRIKINTSKAKAEIDYLRSGLKELSELFKQYNSTNTAESFTSLSNHIERLVKELNVHFRPGLYRTSSMAELFKLAVPDLTVSTKEGSFTLDELRKFSGTVEQNSVNQEMIDQLEFLNIHRGKQELEEFFKVNDQLLQEAYQLNKANNVILAKCLLEVSKDFATIIITDLPITGIAKHLGHNLIDPIGYITKSIEGFAHLSKMILTQVVHSVDTDPQHLHAYAEHSNKTLKGFLEGWQKLEYDKKREFVAQFVADTITGKGVAAILKKFKFFENASQQIRMIAEVIGDVDVVSDGGVALTQPVLATAINTVAEGVEVVGQGIAVLSQASGIAGVLSDAEAIAAAGKMHNDRLKIERGINYVNELGGNIIKEFKSDIFLIKEDHIFSGDHIDRGLYLLGENREDVINKFKDIILDVDKLSDFYKEGPNTIFTVIKGKEVILKAYIKNGKVMSVNGCIKDLPNPSQDGNVIFHVMEKYR